MNLRNVMLLMTLVVLAGCSQRQSQSNVRRSFPGSEIQPVPGRNYEWLIRRSNTVLWVRDIGDTTKIIGERDDWCVVEIFR